MTFPVRCSTRVKIILIISAFILPYIAIATSLKRLTVQINRRAISTCVPPLPWPACFPLYGRRNGNRAAVPYVKCWVFLALLLFFYFHLKVNDVSLFYQYDLRFRVFSLIFNLSFFHIPLFSLFPQLPPSFFLYYVLPHLPHPLPPSISSKTLYLAWTHHPNTIAWLGLLTDPLTSLISPPSHTNTYLRVGRGVGERWGADCALLFSFRRVTFTGFDVIDMWFCNTCAFVIGSDWQLH